MCNTKIIFLRMKPMLLLTLVFSLTLLMMDLASGASLDPRHLTKRLLQLAHIF